MSSSMASASAIVAYGDHAFSWTPGRPGDYVATLAAESFNGTQGSTSGTMPSSQAKQRLDDAIARCARFRIHPSASSGHTSCSSNTTAILPRCLLQRPVAPAGLVGRLRSAAEMT